MPLCFANLIVPIEWVLYGILINDKFVQVCLHRRLENEIDIFLRFIQVPNFLGAILGAIQVSLFFKYPRQSGLMPKAANLGDI